jgi:hypothetical protein
MGAAVAITPPRTLEGDILWGAKAIARFLDCSVDFVETLCDDRSAPVRKRAGRICALKSELVAWLSDGNPR